jgi:hypothetical protein
MASAKSKGSTAGEVAGAEQRRLDQSAARTHNWQRWGPYLAERQWGTVREDYSHDGDAWNNFPHAHAALRAYRWGEDGLLGICDRQCRLCFGLALWNGHDAILKERLFGLTNGQGNHGEDVKEIYFYLDSLPSHAYMKALYKYPQRAYPYARLMEVNAGRGRLEPEYELTDTGIFDQSRYFDVQAEYAKADADDLLIRITVTNRGPEAAAVDVLPTLWFRNTWSWGSRQEGGTIKPYITAFEKGVLLAEHVTLGRLHLSYGPGPLKQMPQVLFTENETNFRRLFNVENAGPYTKDAFHRYLIEKEHGAVNPDEVGTKAAPLYRLSLAAGQSQELRLRLYPMEQAVRQPLGRSFDRVFEERIAEADAFYAAKLPADLNDEQRRIARQSYAGLLWTKQYYNYDVTNWLAGDPCFAPPPRERKQGRNSDWGHLYSRDVLSMPDKWEYPWFAAWDLAFHMLPMARIDGEFAKSQLLLMLREWYMHPSGQLPAYEFNFSDVNPPVHAWAVWRVYKMTGPRGKRDRQFLARCFQKLLLNFTWWVNRKDVTGKHVFAGGFLGLDNIGVFDRSSVLPGGGRLEQADGTAWMAFYCTTMLAMALELAPEDKAYEDMASKLFEHFVAIADAMNTLGGTGLWDEGDGFYYDQLHLHDQSGPLRVRSMVGLIPLFAVEALEDEVINRLPGFRKRMQWFIEHRSDLARQIAYVEHHAGELPAHHLLAIPSRQRLLRVLRYLLDENEFLSPFGIRSLSRVHEKQPFALHLDGQVRSVEYTPGESNSGMFGGNSNWRGPVWFPVNYLLVEALERYHFFYRDTIRVECPTGSGRFMNLKEVSQEIARRLVRIFEPDASGRRPCFGSDPRFAADPHWRNHLLFHEYFHGDTGLGLGASHQTGWTALVTRCMEAMIQK